MRLFVKAEAGASKKASNRMAAGGVKVSAVASKGAPTSTKAIRQNVKKTT